MSEPSGDRDQGTENFRVKTVALGITGSIAAFKGVEIARHFVRRGVRVLPVLTRSGKKFVGPITWTGLTGQVARSDMWDETFAGELHVHLATEADVVLIAPATADILARMAQGRADDLLAALALCAKGPVVVAPAMHPRMWAHPATQRNIEALRAMERVTIIGPVFGEVANGEQGLGRMEEPERIVEAVMNLASAHDLDGKHIVVTAGPTIEDIDPVRFLSNRSTGKMGFALAQRALARGANVTLIAGPVTLQTPPGVHRVDVRSAAQMLGALQAAMGEDLSEADALIMAAAVGDYRAIQVSDSKTKRSDKPWTVTLTANPDLLATIAKQRARKAPMLVGFAVETGTDEHLEAQARQKLRRKGVDLVVGNLAGDSFGKPTNRAVLVTETSAKWMPQMSKTKLADAILDRLVTP